MTRAPNQWEHRERRGPMSGKTVRVVLTGFRNTVAVKKQDEQRERSSVANVVVGTESQWECEWVKPGGGQCDPERETNSGWALEVSVHRRCMPV